MSFRFLLTIGYLPIQPEEGSCLLSTPRRVERVELILINGEWQLPGRVEEAREREICHLWFVHKGWEDVLSSTNGGV